LTPWWNTPLATKDFLVNIFLELLFFNKECVNYCSIDVKSTHEIFQLIWPEFLVHVPNPVSFSGMLEMGTSYLPITRSWRNYINQSESMYNKVTDELKESLMDVAEGVLKLLINDRYV